MHNMKINRTALSAIEKDLKNYPVVAILGARQVGKTTLAKEIKKKKANSIYLDMEDVSDYTKLNEAGLYFRNNAKKLIIIDEIQLRPELFSILRSVIDEDRRNGRFIILGSASPELVNKSSQSLAGRISYHELMPFSLFEVGEKFTDKLWLRGGFPDAFLARNNDVAFGWHTTFIKTFLERDLNMLGFRMSPHKMRQVWTMIAHCHSSTVNYSTLANSLDVTDKTVKAWVNALCDTYMVRTLEPYLANVGKRLVKSPKVYLTDSGILHSLLGIENKDALLSNPILGASWEGFVINQIINVAPARSKFFFYRTSTGDEIDLIVSAPNNKTYAFEVKHSLNPSVKKGFYNALETLSLTKAYVVYSGNESFQMNTDTTAIALSDLKSVF